jgi:hypothetical protein
MLKAGPKQKKVAQKQQKQQKRVVHKKSTKKMSMF